MKTLPKSPNKNPKKNSSCKTRVVSFRVTENDYAQLEEYLLENELSKAEFLKEVMTNKEDKIFFQADITKSSNYRKMVRQINKIGNNINQIARGINVKNLAGEENNLETILEQLIAIEAHLFRLVSFR